MLTSLRERLLRRRVFERAPETLFNRVRIGLPPMARAVGEPGLRASPESTHTEQETRHLEYTSSDLAALNIDLAPMSLVSVTGAERGTYSLDLHAEVACDDQQQARGLLDRLSFQREGEMLVLRNPPSLPYVRCRSFLDVFTPAGRAVAVTGQYAAVQFFGISAPVTLITTHGRASFFDTAGAVDAIASEGGAIVFVGDRGRVRLNADLGIDLKLTSPGFDGTLEADAKGDVRLIIPRGFNAGIEATVAGSRFVCRSSMRSQLRRKRAGGSTIFTCGAGETRLRLSSREGAVIVDEASG
jgi:hypothetical protein